MGFLVLGGRGDSADRVEVDARAERTAVVAAAVPAADERLPRDPRRLARRLAEVSVALNADIDAWLARSPGRSLRPPESVALGALYQQRVYRALARDRSRFARVVRRLPPRLRPSVRDSVRALRRLFRLGGKPPARPRRLRLGAALPPERLRAYYDEAERRFRVPWHVLAAINLVETNFNRNRSVSTAGARGPMQFIPSTWRAFGRGGNVSRPRDAILGAANYLRASGAPGRIRRALWAYNHSDLYVDAVLRFSRRIRAAERNYVALWSWQVFQRTPRGDVRETEPGL